MFDMQQVGRKISAFRKEKNMTQMELADRMGISFQAVSNWERGQTMPDIAKLEELAEIFGVTIDELLGNEKSARVVEKLIKEEPVAEKLTSEEFLEVAPLVKPKQAEKLWEDVDGELDIKQVIMAAPFLSESILDELARNVAKREKSIEKLIGLFPFISDEAVEGCAREALGDDLNLKKIVGAAPFLSEESLDTLADQAFRADRIGDLTPLAPFLSAQKLTELAAKSMEKYGFSKILPLLPYLDQELLDEFVAKRSGGKGKV